MESTEVSRLSSPNWEVVDGGGQHEETQQYVAGFLLQTHRNRMLRREVNDDGREVRPLPVELDAILPPTPLSEPTPLIHPERPETPSNRRTYVVYGQRIADFAAEFDDLFGNRIQHMVRHEFNVNENTTMHDFRDMVSGMANGVFQSGCSISKISMFLQTVYEMTLQLMNRNLGPNIIALVRIVVWIIHNQRIVTDQQTGERLTIANWISNAGGMYSLLTAVRQHVMPSVTWREAAVIVSGNLLMIGALWWLKH